MSNVGSMDTDDTTNWFSPDEIVTNTKGNAYKLFNQMRMAPYIEPRYEEFVVNRDVDISVRRWAGETPGPSCFQLLNVGEKGSMSIDVMQMVRYMSAQNIVFDGDRPYMFDGQIYREVPAGVVKKMINDAVESLGVDSLVLTRNKMGDIYTQVQLHNMAEFFDERVPASFHETFDYEGHLVPFANGLYNIEGDDLLPYTPYVFKRTLLAATYNPRIIDHPVEEVYRGIIPDDDTRKFFFEMVGYMLFSPEQTIPAIFVIYGPGGTGKTALQTAITAALGAVNVSHLDLGQISGTFTTAEMDGKLLNVCGETGPGGNRGPFMPDGQLLKKLSEGQSITVQRKNQAPYLMTPTAKLLFVTNSIPDFGDSTSGMSRRLYVVPCREKQNAEARIYDKLVEDEAVSWLVNQALLGYRRFLKRNMRFSVSPQMSREAMAFNIQDSVCEFLQSYCGSLDPIVIHNQLLGRRWMDLWDEYKEYMEDTGIKPVPKKVFKEKLRNEYRLSMVKKSYRFGDKDTSSMVFVDINDAASIREDMKREEDKAKKALLEAQKARMKAEERCTP